MVISGVSGTGKTTTLVHLERRLAGEPFCLGELDQAGVPSGADDAWRKRRAKILLNEAYRNAAAGFSTILSGTFLPSDFAESDIPIRFCVLEANAISIRKRLMDRYSDPADAANLERVVGLTPEHFASAMETAQAGFLAQFEALAGTLHLDTSEQPSESVVSLVLSWIRTAA